MREKSNQILAARVNTQTGNAPMNRDEFLASMEEILAMSPGTLRGHEKLEELENWDSTSLVSLIAMIDANSGVRLSPGQIVGCSTVEDLLQLANLGRRSF